MAYTIIILLEIHLNVFRPIESLFIAHLYPILVHMYSKITQIYIGNLHHFVPHWGTYFKITPLYVYRTGWRKSYFEPKMVKMPPEAYYCPIRVLAWHYQL